MTVDDWPMHRRSLVPSRFRTDLQCRQTSRETVHSPLRLVYFGMPNGKIAVPRSSDRAAAVFG